MIGEAKTYLETNGSKALKGRTTYTYSSTMPGRVTRETNYVDGSKYVYIDYTYDIDVASPRTQTYYDGKTSYKTRYDYTSMGLVKKITDTMGFTTNYLYDKIGNVTSESFSGGGISTTKSYAYDYTGNTMTYTNENGKRIKYSYDQAGNLTSVVDMENSNNTLEKYTYDVYMRPVTQIEGNAVTTLTYDNRDRVTRSVTNKTGSTDILAQTDYAYTTNATGPLVTTTVQGDNNAVTYTTSVQQDVLGRTVSETNRQGGVTSYTYDCAGNVTKIVPPNINGAYNISYTYDHSGNVMTETESGDGIETVTKSYTYDMLGRMTSSTDGKGNKTTYTYTGTDWVSEIETPFSGTSKGKTKYEYDKAGNVLKESVLSSAPGNSDTYRVTEYEYDALNRVTKYEYDALNRVTKSTVNGSSTTYEYDNVGNMTKSTMANGTQSISYQYDQLNRPTKYTDALGKSEIYTYNNAGDMTSKKDRNGLTTSYTYDALHRLTAESVTKDGKTNKNTYTYALTGQLASESNGSTVKTYKYYKQGTFINDDESVTIDGVSYRTKRTYDTNDNVTETFTYKGGAGEEMYSNVYVYDSKGRLCNYRGRAVTDTDVNNAYNVYYTYDKNDNITNVSVSDNNKKNVKLTSAYSYNNANMLTSLVNKKGSGTTLSSYSYSYNLDGNINKKTETGKTTTYTYDGANRLTGENITKSGKSTNMAYTYDSVGNRLSLTVSGTENYVTTYNYDANNRLIKSSKKNSGASYSDVMYYSYDNNGNQTKIDKAREASTGKMKLGIYSANENSGYGYEFFTYDGFNQLIKYGDEKSNTATYEYLSNGLRLSKTENGEKTSFLWDGNNILFTLTDDETISYSRAPGYMRMSEKIELSNGDIESINRLYVYNGHGDVTGITDKNGELQKTYEYDAFGNEVDPDSSDTNPFRYCGEYYDSETENIYLRARYYNMSTGRFISEDPIKDGLNWYAYCGGNPVMFWDPFGLKTEDKTVMLEGTTYFRQNSDNNCWAANLSMVIAYYQKDNVDRQDEIVKKVENTTRPDRIDRVSYLLCDKQYLETYTDYPQTPFMYLILPESQMYKLNIMITTYIDNGHPLIINFQNAGRGHFITVVGYKIENGELKVLYYDSADSYNEEWRVYDRTDEENGDIGLYEADYKELLGGSDLGNVRIVYGYRPNEQQEE